MIPSYLNGTDEWALWREEDNALYSREVDERDGVLFRVFYNSHQYEFSDSKMMQGARVRPCGHQR